MKLDPVRGPKELRARVDAKLGHGTGMSPAQARDLLSPAERAEWALGECLFAMLDKRFHIWVQGWCLGTDVDGPAVIAAIAEAARPLDGTVADLLRWTSNRGVWARTGERPDALFTVVPEVWGGAWDRVPRFAAALQERWPEDVDPFALPAPAPWSRKEGPVPVRVTYASPTYENVVESTAFALWAAGASDDELDAFFREGTKDLPEQLPRWVRFEGGELEALRAALHPPDPVAALVDVHELQFPSLLLIRPGQEAALLEAAPFYNHVVLRASPDQTVAQAAKAALRRDPDLVVGWARDLKEEDVELFLTILQTGHLVALVGDHPVLRDRADQAGIPVLVK